MKKYVCKVCGYVYDPADNNNVPFEELPDDKPVFPCQHHRLASNLLGHHHSHFSPTPT